MSFNYITNMFAQSSIESGAESAIETGKEGQCRVSIYMREKLDKGLEKTEGALSKVQGASSKVAQLNPLTQKLEQATSWIRSKRTNNQEKIQAEKEEGAWSTLGRIYHGSVAKVKAGAAVVTGVASKIPDALRYQNDDQEVRNPSDYSRFNPMRLLNKVSMPQGSLPKLPEMPDVSIPNLDVSLTLPEVRLPNLQMPRFSFSDESDDVSVSSSSYNFPSLSLSNISMPQVTVPSLPFGLKDKIVEKIQDKIWSKVDEQVDKAMKSAEEYVTDPIKKGQKSVEDLVEHDTGKQGVESMEAVKVIFNHHTAEYQEKASGCYERAKNTVKQIPHWIASGCYSLFYGSAPTEPQPVTV